MQTINKIIKAGEAVSEILMEQSGILEVVIYENARYDLAVLQTGQDLKIKVSLMGTHASCDIRAVYLSATEHSNIIEVDVIHAVPETLSNQNIKGVVTGYAKTDFYGIIRIPHNSQKCEGNQSHKALLLSNNASVKCTPELEIYADDVKCSHGSTVGTLDKSYLFYLQSRGIDESTAKKMLIKAFLSEGMPVAFENKIEEWMVSNE